MLIRNAWYVAARKADIETKLLARTILNEKVVLFRKPDGQVAALEDRCCHRQVPLSKGILREDQVECWYHGLRFDSTGRCVHIPSQPNIPRRVCVRTYPIAEKYGFVWIWIGAAERADEALIPDHWVCSAPELEGEMSYFYIETDYRLGLDNLLDLSHIAFVHPHTIASRAVAEANVSVNVQGNTVRVSRTLRNEPAPPLLKHMMSLDAIDRVQDVVFWPISNTRVETTAHPPGQPDGQKLRLFTTTIFTPETERTMHTWVGMHRDFALHNPELTKLITQQVIVTVNEDKDVTEHLQRNWDASAPTINLAVDQAPLAARRILERLYREQTNGAHRSLPMAKSELGVG
jgi:phenylpropionate dioxygenase-like ring-hydroxylating dioxygenase large terminal subunit